MIRAVDLCCGAGGWAVAARGLPIDWVAVADLDGDCLETWRTNHERDHPAARVIQCDLSTAAGAAAVIDAAAGAAVDLVVGGIPCEPVSVARGANRTPAGEMAAWHALIDRCLEVVAELRPRWWCIEDVIQIERHLPGPLLAGLAYGVRRIEAEDYGPQRRLRSFIGTFPPPAPAEPGPRTVGEVLRPGPYRTVPGADRYHPVLAHQGHSAGHVGRDRVRVLPVDRPSPTVISTLDKGSRQRRSFTVPHGDGYRLLTWQEAAILQGFPDDYLFAAAQRRTEKLVGQAIPIHVGRAILRAITRISEGDGTP